MRSMVEGQGEEGPPDRPLHHSPLASGPLPRDELGEELRCVIS